MRFNARLGLVAAMLAVIALAGCGDEDADVATTGTPDPGAAVDPVDPDAPVSSPPADGPDEPTNPEPPVDLTPVDLAEAQVLVGLELTEAEDEAARRGWTVRVARLDGEDLALTEDYSPTRINVAVDDDVVTEVLFVG